MPYKIKKQGDEYVVYKKDTGKRVGATAGNKEALRKYLAALHINAKEGIGAEEASLIGLLETLTSDYLNKADHIQFITEVLGIRTTPAEYIALYEGQDPSNLKELIEAETLLYESFLDDIAKKIGGIPTGIAKTFTDASSFLKFIYNVISDKTGENLKKGIAILTKNTRAIYARIERSMASVPQQIKDLFAKVFNWIKKVAPTILGVKSDVDISDDLKGDSSNWKKFIMFLVVGMIMVFLSKLGNLIKDMGEDVATNALTKLWPFRTRRANSRPGC